MDLKDKKVLVIGAGRSGLSATELLLEQGAVVALNDSKPVDEWSEAAQSLKSRGVGLIGGDLPTWLMDQIELLVLSPGVPARSIPVRYMERAGATVIGEVELAYRFLQGKIIGITGSNGKTTTTTLIGELLKGAGIPCQVGGNIGTPLTSLVKSSRADGWTVVELSSFQLETIDQFRSHIALVLNITPDHMDRYDSLNDYAAAKHRIFKNQLSDDVAILNADDEIISSWRNGLRAQKIFFSLKSQPESGLYLKDKKIVLAKDGSEKVLIDPGLMKLRGRHNIQNVMAALAAGLSAGADLDSMIKTVKDFNPVEHRLELVAEVNGITFYNDSKATNVDAALKALEAFSDHNGKVIMILGGRGKGAPYTPLAPLLKERARKLILLGEDAPQIERELGKIVPYEIATGMEDSVSRAFRSSHSDDVVLLAPACASFDMFENFEHRGREFKQAVLKLKGQQNGKGSR